MNEQEVKKSKKTLSASSITVIICIASRLLTEHIFHLNPAQMKKRPINSGLVNSYKNVRCKKQGCRVWF